MKTALTILMAGILLFTSSCATTAEASYYPNGQVETTYQSTHVLDTLGEIVVTVVGLFFAFALLCPPPPHGYGHGHHHRHH